MTSLASTSSNVFYLKKENGEYQRVHELIFITEHIEHFYAGRGEIRKQPKLENFRFCVSDEGIDTLIEFLQQQKNPQ